MTLRLLSGQNHDKAAEITVNCRRRLAWRGFSKSELKREKTAEKDIQEAISSSPECQDS